MFALCGGRKRGGDGMTTTATLTAIQAITRVYRMLGTLPSSGSPTNDQTTQAIIAFNAMMKGWQMDGVNLWRQTQLAIPVAAGQGTFANPITVTPLILGLEEARAVVTTSPLYERPLAIYSYGDYAQLPNKTQSSSSGPSVIMFDRQEGASNLQIWPLWTYGGTINATVARSVNDVVNVNDPIDVPVEWLETVLYNLADRLMDDEAVMMADPATGQRITERAVAFYTKAKNFDRPSSVFMRPWGKKGTGKPWR